MAYWHVDNAVDRAETCAAETISEGKVRMAAENTNPERVTFGRGYSVWIMAIDGTWRRNCILRAVSAIDAELTLEGSIEGLHLKEFFLLLSSTGLAYRRCELVRVNGADIDIRFLNTKGGRAKSRKATDREAVDA